MHQHSIQIDEMQDRWVEAPDDFLNAVILDVINAKISSEMEDGGILQIGVERYDAASWSSKAETVQFTKQNTKQMMIWVRNFEIPNSKGKSNENAASEKFLRWLYWNISNFSIPDDAEDSELMVMDLHIGDIIDVYDHDTKTWFEAVITFTVIRNGYLLFFRAHIIGKRHYENKWYFAGAIDCYTVRGTHTNGPYRSNTYAVRRPYVGYPKFEISAPGASDGTWKVVWEHGNSADFVVKDGKFSMAPYTFQLDERRVTIPWNDYDDNYSILEYMEEDGTLKWITTNEDYPIITWKPLALND